MPVVDQMFLQIFFMDSCKDHILTQCQYNSIGQVEEAKIEGLLEDLIENCNQLYNLFKKVLIKLRN